MKIRIRNLFGNTETKARRRYRSKGLTPYSGPTSQKCARCGEIDANEETWLLERIIRPATTILNYRMGRETTNRLNMHENGSETPFPKQLSTFRRIPARGAIKHSASILRSRNISTTVVPVRREATEEKPRQTKGII